MKIERFVGTSVNGYLHFDVEFFRDLTFLTGINGSGKTSALNSIAALLLPRLDYLAAQDFQEISIELSHQNEHFGLAAKKSATGAALTCTLFPDESFNVPEFEEPESIPSFRREEYEEEYYREILSRNAENQILKFITSLPTPMYLGLNRRSLSIEPGRFRRRSVSASRRRFKRHIFGRSLEAGLTEALYFARERFQEDRRRQLSLDERFRRNLVFELMDFPLFSLSHQIEVTPSVERRKIRSVQRNLERLPQLLNLGESSMLDKFIPVFEFLREKMDIIQRSEKESRERVMAQFEWSVNKSNIDKIIRLSELISEYNEKVEDIKRHTNEYLSTLNGFITDSRKQIAFNSVGDLKFKVADEEVEREINTFSSGELQLVVILTNLYFNPEVEKANIFVIDEPELSLHVDWQEKFVDGLVEASKQTQFILATHSPSIILDRTSNCVEISQL